MTLPDADAGLDRALLHDAIVHDLGNLLTAVTGGAEGIAESEPGDSSRREAHEVLAAAGEATLLVRLLSRQAWEGGPVAARQDLTRVLRVASRLGRKLVPRGVEVRWTPFDSPLPVVADEVRVAQVLLVACARLGARSRAGEALEIRAEGDGDEVRVRVSDGTDSPARGDEPRGAASRLAREAGGTLSVANGTWELVLSNRSAPDEGARGAGVRLDRVLVAESDGLVRSFLVSTLPARTPLIAHDARSLESLLERRAAELDLLVLGTGLSGFDLVRDFARLRARHPELAVVLVAGDERASEELLDLAGADPRTVLLVRPFGASRLAASIAELTEGTPHPDGERVRER